MSLLGLPLSSLIALFAAVGAATTVLYILKLRRRPVAVAFAPIWRRVLKDKEATQLFSQLKRILSLLLQLALIALMVFALGDPRFGSVRDQGRHIVALVDASASMKAHDVLPTRLDEAKVRLKKYVEGLSANDRMLVVQLDATPTPLSTMSADTSELKSAVDAVQATDTAADLERGLAFARDSLKGLSEPEIMLLSDGAFGDALELIKGIDVGGAKVSFEAIGSGHDNVAITEFSVRRYPLERSRYEVMLEITSTLQTPAEVELSLFGDGQLLDVSRLVVKPGERLPRFYQDLAGADRTLMAQVKLLGQAADQLAADDRAFALMPERHRVRVLVVSPGNTYLEAALLLDEYLDVSWVEPGATAPDGHFDVAILDGTLPPEAADIDAFLYLNPPLAGAPVEQNKKIADYGFDEWDRKSPIVRYIALENVQVASGFTLRPGKGDKVVGASELGPILVTGRRQGHPFIALGFDPRNSDIVLRVAWPLFLLNSINYFVEQDKSYLSSYRTGEVWQLPVAQQVDFAELKRPDGVVQRLAVKESRAAFFGLNAGFYELAVGSGAERVNTMFAANLSDRQESAIAPVKELEFAPGKALLPQGFSIGTRQQLWGYLLLAVALISVLEWLSYHRRVTV